MPVTPLSEPIIFDLILIMIFMGFIIIFISFAFSWGGCWVWERWTGAVGVAVAGARRQPTADQERWAGGSRIQQPTI